MMGLKQKSGCLTELVNLRGFTVFTAPVVTYVVFDTAEIGKGKGVLLIVCVR